MISVSLGCIVPSASAIPTNRTLARILFSSVIPLIISLVCISSILEMSSISLIVMENHYMFYPCISPLWMNDTICFHNV